MTIHPFPQGEGEQKRTHKLPEFVIIDDRREEFRFEEDVSAKQTKRVPPQIPFRVRFLCLVASSFVTIWLLFAFLFTLLFASLSLLMLRRVEPINRASRMYWNWTKSALVIALGLFIAVFNTTLGIVFILCYFSQVQENWQKNVFSRVLYPHMQNYM